MSTIFGKILNGSMPAVKVHETDQILAIEDAHPVAPVHILIIPKKQYENLQAVPPQDLPILTDIVAIAQTLAEKMGIADNYRFLTNNGARAGQSIFHLHFHLIGGKKLGPMA